MANSTAFKFDDDSDRESDASFASGVENESDFEDDVDADYLALELVNHLPEGASNKLMKSLRAKENAVQDLLIRNKSLLESCKQLDDENQKLVDQVTDLEQRPASSVAPPAPKAEPSAPSAPKAEAKPAPKVDTSYFDKMEQGKEEKILRLRAENEKLTRLTRQWQERVNYLQENLTEKEKEIKTLTRSVHKAKVSGGSGAPERAPVPDDLLNEEERYFQQLQEKNSNDVVQHRMKKAQEDQQKKIQGLLGGLFSENVKQIQNWDSDASAVLLAVDSLEKLLASAPKDAKKEKKKGGGAKEVETVSSDRFAEASAELLDDFENMRNSIEHCDRIQVRMEQTVQGFADGASEAASTLDLGEDMETAEQEVNWIKEHNAAWVERVGNLSQRLDGVSKLLSEADNAVSSVMSSAPPGLIPQRVEQCMHENSQQLRSLQLHLRDQVKELTDLHQDSMSFGRHVRALQNAQKTHMGVIRESYAGEMQKIFRSLNPPLQELRELMRKRDEAEDRARKRAMTACEDFGMAVKKFGVPGAASTVSESQGGGLRGEALADANSAVKELRGLMKALRHNLQNGGKSVEGQMADVLTALSPDDDSKNRPGGFKPPARQNEEEAPMQGDAKKNKRGKKKGRAPAKEEEKQAAGQAAEPNDDPNESEVSPQPSPTSKPALSPEEAEEAALRAELCGAFVDRNDEAEPTGRKSKKVVSGKELLQELRSLKQEGKALEKRMQDRMQKKEKASTEAADGEPADAEEPTKAVATKKKKRYA